MTRVIGLISGTSVDGIDAVLVNISGTELDLQIELLKGATYPYSEALSEQIMAVCQGAAISMAELARLDDAIAQVFAQAALNIQASYPSAQLIGSHGQNIYHRPAGEMEGQGGYTLQIGRGDLIARLTGIPTISNFRVADVAAGGQGAPLVPKVDAYLLSHLEKSRCVQNLGGIGNVAYLPARSNPHWLEEIRGWDTGPANTLIDLAVQHYSNGAQSYDEGGEWAASGTPCQNLVDEWLRQDFFHQAPPKSTGRELFGSQYLARCLLAAEAYRLSPADMLATLTELTVASIVHSYQTFLPQLPEQVLLCGGGSKNIYLKERLQARLQPTVVSTTDDVGLSADFKEAIAFAVLAYWRNLEIPGNLPQVTGAKQQVLLGHIHPVYF
ncbi:anhydro-N-acetylmuramic acid kinase [Aliterella atlantica]|uniref:Anhydro-N-acetylmuramic acid kinase n=1 Tax=Aliterella atlantica CENA595 TaxID=1618023 RepID=A0A0D8ZWR3_9CYAN|nr:anhydro-N-acetylmuramic acid kinase [Aliterella atlantica]KJH73198.1 anhydro-N-acetylmuramic acid kinase [Aliterella atlantica CENA595]